MDTEILKKLCECQEREIPAALVTIIAASGSAPGKPGALMVVEEDGSTMGTIGGGGFEHKLTAEAVACINQRENREYTYDLSSDQELQMICGGKVRAFIRVFHAAPKLVIIGAGHIGLELYKLGSLQGFKVVVFDSRGELASKERFPQAELKVADDIAAALREYPLSSDCYLAIAASTHETDRLALEAVVLSSARYIGMIGSSSKIRKIFKYLLDNNVSRAAIEKVYAPMGLNIASVKPCEIALAIFSEILMVKNNGSPEQMCRVKKNLLP